jgi:CRP-like cAMP-binding protein
MTDNFTPLIAHIRKYVHLDDREAGLLADSLQFRSVKKKEFLLKEQQVCETNYFVLKGCLRLYFIQETGAEQIIQFGIENWWITDQQSLDWQQPSHFYLQAVEATELAVLDRTTATTLLDQIPCLDRYFRLIAQRAFAASQQNRYFVQNLSGEERYHQFARGFPDFVQRIPQYMIASFLGFTPEFISKIRRRK